MKVRTILMMSAILIIGCTPAAPTLPPTQPPPPTATLTPIPTPKPESRLPVTLFPAETGPESIDCQFREGQYELSALRDQVIETFAEADLTNVEVYVEAFGAYCINTSGEQLSFTVWRTNFEIDIPVSDVTDRATMGDLARRILSLLLADYPPESTPGSQPGRVRIRFTAGDEFRSIWVTPQVARDALNANLSGEAFLDALR